MADQFEICAIGGYQAGSVRARRYCDQDIEMKIAKLGRGEAAIVMDFCQDRS